MTVAGISVGEKLQSPIRDSTPQLGLIANCSQQLKQTGEPSTDCSRESTNGDIRESTESKQGLNRVSKILIHTSIMPVRVRGIFQFPLTFHSRLSAHVQKGRNEKEILWGLG